MTFHSFPPRFETLPKKAIRAIRSDLQKNLFELPERPPEIRRAIFAGAMTETSTR